jgi:hypothetical protein
MKQTLFLTVLGIALILLAVGGWTVSGLRRALPIRRPALAGVPAGR